MGRKRNQGKARKAAKAKAKQEAEERDNQAIDERRQPPAAQLQQLQSGNTKCRHGIDSFESEDISTSSQFARAFYKSFCEASSGVGRPLMACLLLAENATMDEFADVWNDSAKMENMMSWFLFVGTQAILKGEYDSARGDATIVRFMEQHVAVELKETQALYNLAKLHETYDADLHTLVKFFRHRIPCSCLDEKYEEVKDIVKMGMCFNPQCAHPNRMTERSKTMYCSRCRCATYCSRECQKAAWANHKPCCDKDKKIQAEFDARQQNSLPR